MDGLIHFVFQTAALLSLFVIMRRARWEALHDPEAPESGRDASEEGPADSFGSSRAETRILVLRRAIFKKIAMAHSNRREQAGHSHRQSNLPRSTDAPRERRK